MFRCLLFSGESICIQLKKRVYNNKCSVCAQEVEYVKEEAKMVYLLECLQKTPPPVSTSALWHWCTPEIHHLIMSDLTKWRLLTSTGADICWEEGRRRCHPRVSAAKRSRGGGHPWRKRCLKTHSNQSYYGLRINTVLGGTKRPVPPALKLKKCFCSCSSSPPDALLLTNTPSSG